MRYAPYEFKPDDAYGFARHVGILCKERGNELFFKTCPYCKPRATRGNVNTFSINLKTGQHKCLRASCGVSGNMITLARDFDFSLGTEIDEYYAPKKKYRELPQPKEPLIPKTEALQYLESRGISEEVAKRYEITVQTKNPNILVFPFYDEVGKLKFVKYRKTDFDKTKDANKEWCESKTKPILFGMKQCDTSFKRLVITEGQCFDGKAEILTPDGWVSFENYAGQYVLQVDEKMNGTFTRPNRVIIKRHIGNMVRCRIGGNYETYTTDDHNLVLISPSGDVVKKKAGEKISSIYRIPTAISINSDNYKNWTNEMFALYLAISADGTIDFRKNTGNHKAKSDRYVRIAIPLERKSKRLQEILNSLGIEYSCNKNSRNYDSICFHCPDWLESKYLPYGFATGTSIEQKKFIIEEMVNWDGNRVKGKKQYEYSTIIKHNADVMQAIATSCGYMSTIMTKQNGGNDRFVKSYCYKVSVLLSKTYVTTQQFEKHKEIEKVDQRVYCVSVDTGMILIRQNGKISVTGNCDTLAVATAGINNVVSVPTGAKGFTWVPYCWNWLCKWEEIIVFGDYEKGSISLLDELSKRLKTKIKHVREEDYIDCKDANEILLKYGKEQIIKCVENAIPIPVENVIDLADVKDVDPYSLEKIPTRIQEVDKLLCGGLIFGCVNLITGKSGKGKSTLASQILGNAIDCGYNVFAYSGELPNFLFKSAIDFQSAGPQNVIEENRGEYVRRYVRKSAKEEIEEWYRGKCMLYDRTMVNDEDTDLLKTIEQMIISQNVRVILIDNLMTMISQTNVKGSKLDSQSNISHKLEDMARFYNVCIILVAHKRKDSGIDDEDMDDSIRGDSDIVNSAGVIIHYNVNKDEVDMDEFPRIIAVTKNRVFGRTNYNGWKVKFDEKSKRIYGNNDDPDYLLGWNKSDGFVQTEYEESPFT